MAYFITILAVITTFGISTSEAVNAVKVAAFNVQVFGQTKISKNNVRDILVKIVNRYDIILIQEIRDSGEDAIKILLENVNNFTQSSGSGEYEMIVSGRLGRSVSKEQYAFLYRKSIATVKASYTYFDKNDDFEREPYVVHFRVPSAAVSDLVFVAIHTKPDDAVSEVDKLVDVYDDVVKRWKIKNIVIMGDFNAACNYVRDTEWENIRLANDKRFWWLIDDCQDTTVKGSRCAYDRIIATGDYLLKNIVGESPGLFDFKSAYQLKMQEADDVSDHFPIEFQIKHKGWKEQETLDYVLRSVLPSGGKNAVYTALRKHPNILRPTLYKRSGGMARIMFNTTKNNIASAITCVQTLQSTFTSIMGDIQAKQAERYLTRLQSQADKYPYQVFSQYRNMIDVKIGIQLIWNVNQLPVTCRLVISKYL